MWYSAYLIKQALLDPDWTPVEGPEHFRKLVNEAGPAGGHGSLDGLFGSRALPPTLGGGASPGPKAISKPSPSPMAAPARPGFASRVGSALGRGTAAARRGTGHGVGIGLAGLASGALVSALSE